VGVAAAVTPRLGTTPLVLESAAKSAPVRPAAAHSQATLIRIK